MDDARRQLISERTREAIARRKRAGIYRGPPRLVSDDIVEIIVGLRRRGWSLRRICWLLDAEGRQAPRAQLGSLDDQKAPGAGGVAVSEVVVDFRIEVAVSGSREWCRATHDRLEAHDSFERIPEKVRARTTQWMGSRADVAEVEARGLPTHVILEELEERAELRLS